MKYLLLVVLFLTVSCNKEETPQYNPIYSKIQGDWYTGMSGGFIQKLGFSLPQDSIHTQVNYPAGSTPDNSTIVTRKYYIDNSSNIFLWNNSTNNWSNPVPIKIENDTLLYQNRKYYR